MQHQWKSLDHKKASVRVKAAQELGQKKAKEALKPLVNMLKNDKLYNARISAALALYNIGDKSVLPVLKERVTKDENLTVRSVLSGIIKEMES